MTLTPWFTSPPYEFQAKYCLYPGTYTKDTLWASMAYTNIETYFAYSRSVDGLDYGYQSDYPLPALELCTRPRRSEIVQYADWSQRAQGPYSFTWGFRVMKPFVFGEYLYRLGLQKYDRTNGYVYDFDIPLWTSPICTIVTFEGKGLTNDNYRCFQGYMNRPVPNKDYKPSLGGNYENVLFHFVGCTEIFS